MHECGVCLLRRRASYKLCVSNSNSTQYTRHRCGKCRYDVRYTPRQVATHLSYIWTKRHGKRWRSLCRSQSLWQGNWENVVCSIYTRMPSFPMSTQVQVYFLEMNLSPRLGARWLFELRTPPCICLRIREAKFLNDAQLQMHDTAPLKLSTFNLRCSLCSSYICVCCMFCICPMNTSHQPHHSINIISSAYSSSGIRCQF